MAYLDRREVDLTLAGEALSGNVRDYVLLLKPRVMSLVVFTALVGMALAPGAIHPVIGLLSLFAIAVGAGAAGALNMWWDAGSRVLLSAEPAAGSRFVRWSGGCTGGAECDLTLAAATSVTARFGPARIPVAVRTAGRGRVACTPATTGNIGTRARA